MTCRTLMLTALTSLTLMFALAAPPASAATSVIRAQPAPSIHDWYHLSEGSEFFPTDWALALEGFEDGLGAVGARRDDSATNPYLINWVGITSAWSDADPRSSDALRGDEQTRVRWIGTSTSGLRRASIKMSGINCAYCHTSNVGFAGNTAYIEGGAGMIDIEGFFGSLGRSLLTTMLSPSKLSRFLSKFGVPHAQQKADLFVADFAIQLGVPTLIELAKNKPAAHFYAKNELFTRYLMRLLKLTHAISARNADLARKPSAS